MDVLPILAKNDGSDRTYCTLEGNKLSLWNGKDGLQNCEFLHAMISGGDFQGYITEVLQRNSMVCLVLVPRSVCFELPCPDGHFEELDEPPINPGEYSKSLMCQFFHNPEDVTVIITDDERTLAEKLKVAADLGVPYCAVPERLIEKMKTP